MTSPSAFPRTRAEALAMRAWYRCRWRKLFAEAELAARRAEMARGELSVIEDMAKGLFEDAGEYATGSSGSWQVAAGARGIGSGWAS